MLRQFLFDLFWFSLFLFLLLLVEINFIYFYVGNLIDWDEVLRKVICL
jgi:hypothetical protein